MVTRTLEKLVVRYEENGEQKEKVWYGPRALDEFKRSGITGQVTFSTETRQMTEQCFVENSEVKGVK